MRPRVEKLMVGGRDRTVLVDGVLSGRWRRSLSDRRVDVVVTPFAPPAFRSSRSDATMSMLNGPGPGVAARSNVAWPATADE